MLTTNMKRLSIGLLFLAFLGGIWLYSYFNPSTTTNSKGLIRTSSADQVSLEDMNSFSKETKIAILVGIDDYTANSNLSPLNYAVNDVKSLQTLLQEKGYVVKTITNEKANKNFILREIRKAGEFIEAGTGTVLFSFSGHGFTNKDKTSNIIAPYDTDNDNEESLNSTALSLDTIVEALRNTKARQMIMLVDACRNNVYLSQSENVKSVSGNGFTLRQNTGEGLSILFSTKLGGVSYESDKLKHGVFSHFLLEGIRGKAAKPDGVLTFNDLADYVEEKVKLWTYSNNMNTVQKPYRAGEHSGVFVMASGYQKDMKPTNIQQQSDTYALTIQPTPYDSTIEIINHHEPYKDRMQLPINKQYRIKISKAGYETKIVPVTLDTRDRVLIEELETDKPQDQQEQQIEENKLYALTVSSNPSSAIVSITNIQEKYSNGIMLKPGRYNIKVKKAGYKTRTFPVDLTDRDRTITADLQKETKKYKLTVKTSPSNARVRVMEISQKYRAGISLISGTYTVKVDKSGYRPKTVKVSISNKNRVVNVSLKKNDRPKQIISKNLGGDVNFKFGSSSLTTAARSELSGFIRSLKGVNIRSVTIAGHTDAVGSEANNLSLSKRRAATVANYLVSRGVSGSKISAVGYGESQATLPASASNAARMVDNRVDITIRGTVTVQGSSYGGMDEATKAALRAYQAAH